ncbi:hypothetical protein [Pseudomonas sp. GL-B-19]|uniref:hypothetical protein n=1 Tax=Pseudomonas sp. GL-B-19 TaxID=2832393 RepID=UPI001CBCB45C|nr:hypothetical protein [Pseudomonas sp. GL-B-19]
MNAKVELGNRTRAAFLRQQNSRVEGLLADPPPASTITQQTLLPDLRIPIEHLVAPLEYTIPKPTAEAAGDLIQLFIRVKDAPDWVELQEFIALDDDISGRQWPLPLLIPVGFLIEETKEEPPTEYELQYVYWAGGTNNGDSLITTFAVDKTAPYKIKVSGTNLTPAAPTWPADLGPTVPIDEDSLAKYQDGVPVKAATYGNYHATDRVKFFWGVAPDTERDEPVFEGVLPVSLEVKIPTDVFRNGDEGSNSLVYVVTDLAGNKGKRSNASTRNVVFLPGIDPSTVLPPVIPLANGVGGDDLIDLADSQMTTVVVQVPKPSAPKDSIVIYWGEQQISPEQEVGTSTELTFTIPYDDIKSDYGNTDGEETTKVSYKMFRTGKGEIATNFKNIKVDISYIGPDPILIGLDPPTLKTTKGNDDEILEEDYGDNGIKVSIKLFATPPTEEGWLIDVFYDDIKVGATIPLTTDQEGTTLSVDLPWQTVLAQQSGTKVLRYVLFTVTGNNPTRSRTKDIIVEEFPIEMAKPEVLKLAGPAKLIGCSTLNFGSGGDGNSRRNLQVRISKNKFTVDKETITLTWKGETSDTPPTPIETTATHDIDGEFPDEGVVIEIGTYLTHFRPLHGVDGVLTYSITRDGGADTPESLPATHRVFLTNSELQYCEEVDPLP